ncbi:MAG: S1 RNA-binding domain-containing protein [Chloroflexi bacterium]|nr:S1 RNA-binding domain-containing protein [Chloroflexota bacterium]
MEYVAGSAAPETQPQEQAPEAPAITGGAEHVGRVSLSAEESVPISVPEQSSEQEVAKENSHSMEQALAGEYDYQGPRRGELRRGTVLAMNPDGMIVDLGLKREGLVPANDLQRVDKKVLAGIHPGDVVPVYVLRPRDHEGNLIVSLHRGWMEQDWIRAEELASSRGIWEGQVTGYNRGGLIVPFGRIRGFVPASHLANMPRSLSPAQREERMAKLVGQKLPLKVIEVDREHRRLVFSVRLAMREWRAIRREQLLNSLQEGSTVRGRVSSIADFGVFVDLGGADGLIHISELSWGQVQNPRKLVKVGDELEAHVLRVDREHNRIALSLKRLRPDPWLFAEDNYWVDQLVEGTVSRVVDFGAFVELEEGIEGLVHVSELANKPPADPRRVIAEGERHLFRVIKVDARRRRIGLSLRRVTDEEREEWLARQEEEEASAPASAIVASGSTGEAEPKETGVETVLVSSSEEVQPAANAPAEATEEIPVTPPDENESLWKSLAADEERGLIKP